MAPSRPSVPHTATQSPATAQQTPTKHCEASIDQSHYISNETIFYIAGLPPDERQTAVKALPKEMRDQSQVLASSAEVMAQASGEPIYGYVEEQLKYLLGTESDYERYFQTVAKAMVEGGNYQIHMGQIRDCISTYRAEIFQGWRVLRALLGPYEAVIRTRWSKETRAGRKAILLAAQPDMPESHRPDIEAFFEEDGKSTSKKRLSLFCPYMNLEDLMRPKALLMFLNSRGRNSPVPFAYSDLELAPLFKTRQEILDVYPSKFTMRLFDNASLLDYGALVEWPDESAALESIRSGRTKHMFHGIDILLIQSHIYTFLARCVIRILHDKDLASFPPPAPHPEPPQLSEQDRVYGYMGIIAREAPYRVPNQLDLSRLHELVTAQKTQAIDHAWALREDPEYFASTAEEYREHRSELILDEKGDPRCDASDFPLYNRAVRQMAADAHCMIFVWHEIEQRLSLLKRLRLKYASSITVKKDLPSEFCEALTETWFFVQCFMLDMLSDLPSKFHSAPALRPYHYRDSSYSYKKRASMVRSVKLKDNDIGLKHLLRLKHALCDHGARKHFTTHAILDEVEHLMQNDARTKSMISAYLTKHLAHLSVLAECLHQFRHYQPWAHRIEADVETCKWGLSLAYDKIFSSWGEIWRNHEKFEEKELYNLCTPRDGKFDYPTHKRPTRENITKLISAEAALDAFWEGADAHWLRLVNTTPTALVKHVMGERKLVRTPPWVPPASTMTTKTTKVLQPLIPEQDVFPEYAHDVTKQITGAFAKSTLSNKSKTKTKGTATNCADITVPAQAAIPSPPPRTTFKVDKRSLKVFQALFYTPHSPHQSGEVAWPDLLHAMISLGFGAEKLRSSAWHFTPPDSIEERSIQLHEPHPVSKLPFYLARQYGKRLHVAYQWTSDSFELV